MNINKDLLLDVVHPIGSIYMSASSVSPATLFGGTWTRIKDVFLLAAGSTYSAGSTGGSAKHTHNYGVQFGEYYGDTISDGLTVLKYDSSGNITLPGNSKQTTSSLNRNNGGTSGYTSTSVVVRRTSANTSYTSTLPPYLTVYVWKRTA